MLKPHYGTALVSREDVKPGTAILYNEVVNKNWPPS
ncbi:Uncharacterised protein [Shigella dysenteriae]|uniref:Uncharacterized protein n=1 Tax=Shigella dysenteriae TaxID=622 RepID=A0A2X2I877_SHIDY|nr:Uncharacterised protein [Shigella dysenteriae]